MHNYQCNVIERIVLPSDLCNLGVEGLVEYADNLIKCSETAAELLGLSRAIADYGVGSLPAAVRLVVFWIWHPSEQPYQVIAILSP